MSDELKAKLREIIAHYTDWLEHDEYHISDEDPDMCRNEIDDDEAIAQIDQVYAGAISEIIGEELDYDKYGKCPACGATYMYQCTCDQGSLYTINQQRQRLQRLLPTNGSDGGGADKPHGGQQ